MCVILSHRGPDGVGLDSDGPVCFGHRRLAVIDLSEAAAQPMWDRDKSILLTFNGEIYNYLELKSELVQLGASFKTSSDTEVLLEAYKAWGIDALKRMNGMFAFALWDRTRQRILLARDRLGEKPLYWQRKQDGLAFASEIKALLPNARGENAISSSALRSYLTLGYVCGPQSISENIERLDPGSFLLIERGSAPRIERYWDLVGEVERQRQNSLSFEDATERLSELIDNSVGLRMLADVPVGAFLSGGLDSATVAASMRRARSRPDPLTFSLGFAEDGFSEVRLARQTAAALHTVHRDTQIRTPVGYMLPAMLSSIDEPFADSSLLPMFELCKFTRQFATVALSGDGADELFAGYPTYAANALRAKTGALPKTFSAALLALLRTLPADHGKVSAKYKLRQFLQYCHLPFEKAHFSWRRLLPEDSIAALMGSSYKSTVDPFSHFERAFAESDGWDDISQAGYVDLKTWLPDDILVKVDRASMAHGLEVRCPFLDHRIVEFALQLPGSFKLAGKTGKRILRKSQEIRLPKAVVQRKKTGFNAPISHWYQREIAPHLERILSEGRIASALDISAVQKIRDDYVSRKQDSSLALFAITILGLWMERGRV